MVYVFLFLFLATCQLSAPESTQAQSETQALIDDALRAAPVAITEGAKIMDWDGNVLQDGDNGWTCYPTPPHVKGATSPMCLDRVWVKWADAWMNKKEFKTTEVGISYMLAGDAGASNIDPWASEETPDNEWVVTGPHLMILAPDESMFAGIPHDPSGGGPYVMWRDTPYVHIMVPVE